MGSNRRKYNHKYVTIPPGLVRHVLGKERTLSLLTLLVDRDEPVRYSRARDALDLHPQQFQRTLDTLEEWGLVGLKAPADLNKPHAERDYYVFLELTELGRVCVELWHRINQEFDELAQGLAVTGPSGDAHAAQGA